MLLLGNGKVNIYAASIYFRNNTTNLVVNLSSELNRLHCKKS